MLLEQAYDDMEVPVYIADADTYEILYANKKAIQLLGDVTGEKCYCILNGTETICESCTNAFVKQGGAPKCGVKSRFLSKLNIYVDTYESLVQWEEGRQARLCVMIDVTTETILKIKTKDMRKRTAKCRNSFSCNRDSSILQKAC